MSNQQPYGAPQYPPQYQPQMPYQFQPPPPQQQQFGWGPQPPRKKKSKAWLAVVIPLALGVVVIGGLWTIGVVAKHNRHNDYTQPQPTYSYSPEPQPTAEPTTTAPKPPAPQPTKTTPPPPRQPTPYEIVTRDGFYRGGVQTSVGCRMPGTSAPNIRAAAAFNAAIKACLDRAWPRQVRTGRDVFRPPNLVTMNGSVSSPCGGSSGRSFYCDSNRTIYIDGLSDVRAYAKYKANYSRVFLKVSMADTMAHEYGHHLQNLTGISSAFDDLWYDAPNRTARLEVNRRMEIQATCFAAIFDGANRNTLPITGEYKRQWVWLSNNSGDEYDTERTHGSKYIQPYWMNRGFNSRNVALCNTFTATSDKVR
ncbi:neutral zinc metallopeptidase [Kribbella sp. NPDC051770]|uniref:neutral zinc metallopeptidase n=1 Tax=Kribbella sp. NPDC051770 TaxID=3155413 RepID=UPI0034199B8A